MAPGGEIAAADVGAGVARQADQERHVMKRQQSQSQELLRGDVGAMKRRTRNYAKRQLTWMRKLAGVRVVDVSGRTPLDVAGELAREL